MSKNRGLSALVLLIVCVGLGAAHVSTPRQTQSYEMASRSTQLGPLKTSQKKNKKETMVLMNDPNMKKSWGNSSIDTQKAWRITQGSKKITVAVIDTGVDVNHPDIKANLWVNKNESKNNRLGFVGDIHGWNFVDNNSNLTDNHGHGTHIAGIIGAVGGNGIGISGVAPKVSLMILKYYDPLSTHNNNLKNTILAFEYAIQNGADIINYSGGGTSPSPKEKAVIAKAQRLGILVVAAAGNESSNSDLHGYYPADYKLDNIISVTAINKSKTVLASSNYGLNSVDIAAPGHSIYSTIPRSKGSYGLMTGTSQATAFVSGVAALIKANNPTLKAAAIIKYLKFTGDKEPTLIGKTRYQRKINTYNALTTLDQGVGLTGVVAENTTAMKPSQFTVEAASQQNIYNGDSAGQFSKFSKTLLSHIKTNGNTRRLANKKKPKKPNL